MTRLAERLYAIVDAAVAQDPIALAERSLRAGCAWLQLRAKRLDDRRFMELATQLQRRCAAASTPFVINDRADIAVVVGADGLHLGQDDMRVSEARRIVGSMSIGVSTHSVAQACRAQTDGADLIAFGPVFPTKSKENPDPVVGLEALRTVRDRVDRPVVAIGGITPENAGSVLDAGASYVAVISALERFVDAW